MTQPLKTTPPMMQIDDRRRTMNRMAALVRERSSWMEHWQDLAKFFFPRGFRSLGDRNNGGKKNDKIINNTGTKAARVLGAGKHAGETSPARQHFRYTLSEPDLKSDAESLAYVSILEAEANAALARSNLYAKIHELWFLQGVFATATLYIEEDEKDDVRGYIKPLGQYCLASSKRNVIDTYYEEFEMTVDQVVTEFGLENVCTTTQEKWRDGTLDDWIVLVHKVEPNVNRQTGKIDNHNMPWISVWYEKAAPEGYDRPLRKSGYEEFPYVTARWGVIGEDIYGSGSPGMDALGDVKALQLLEKRKAELVDKAARPPMKAPVSARTQRLSMLPGDVSYVDEAAQGAKFEPLIEVKAEQINAVESSISQHERRIFAAFFADLFQMMLLDERQQPSTAREVTERHEEKMLQLGPVVENDQDDVLDPLHNRLVRILTRRGKVPPPPPQLLGRRVKIEYTSVMAQAQKLMGVASVDRFLSVIGSVSAIDKSVLDVPNFDRIARRYADMLGIPADDLNTEEVVQKLREAAAAKQQLAEQTQMAGAAAQGAKIMSETDMGGDTALSRLLNTTGGGGGPIASA